MSTTGRAAPPSRQSDLRSPSSSGQLKKGRRALIACRSCREKRSRCDGGRPCKQCEQHKWECLYEHSERRVWISQTDYLQLLQEKDDAQRRCAELEARVNRGRSVSPLGTSPAVDTYWSVQEDELQEGRGRLLTDDRGVARYMGDSSGAAFYSAVVEILPMLLPPGVSIDGPHTSASYQTWDSRPLPMSMVDPYTLPPSHLARHLVSIFFQHCSDTLYFVDPVEFKSGVDSLYGTPLSLDGDAWALAQFYIVLALASLHVASPLADQSAEDILLGLQDGQDFPGMAYFAKANVLLSGYPERSCMSGAQTLALVAFYLLSVCHRDAAYAYIGGAMRMAVSLGLHRRDTHNGVFWTIYTLDRLISFTLGRPVQVANEDITTIRPTAGLGFNVRIASVQTALLSGLYVNGSAARRLYSLPHALQLLGDAKSILNELNTTTLAMQNPRSEAVLKLTCSQTIITTCRHAMLLALRIRLSPFATDSHVSGPINELCQEALQAAKDSIRRLEVLSMTGMILPWCFHDCHVAYNAGTIIILGGLLNPAEPAGGDLDLVLAMLDFMSSRGNESAASCKSILIGLSAARVTLPPVTGALHDAAEWESFLQSIGMHV